MCCAFVGTEDTTSVDIVSSREPASASSGPTVYSTDIQFTTTESGNGVSVYWFLAIPVGIIVVGSLILLILCGLYKKRNTTKNSMDQSMYKYPGIMNDAGNGGYQYIDVPSVSTGQQSKQNKSRRNRPGQLRRQADMGNTVYPDRNFYAQPNQANAYYLQPVRNESMGQGANLAYYY